MCRIILCKPQREEDKLIDHEEERRQTHPDITNMISPVLTHIQMKFYYRKYMLKKKKFSDNIELGIGPKLPKSVRKGLIGHLKPFLS